MMDYAETAMTDDNKNAYETEAKDADVAAEAATDMSGATPEAEASAPATG